MFTLTLGKKLVIQQVVRFLIITSLCALLLNGYYKVNSHFLLLSHANSLGEIVLGIRQLEESFLLKEEIDFKKLLNSIDLAKLKLESLKNERKRIKSKDLIQHMMQEFDLYASELGLLKHTLGNNSSSLDIFQDIKRKGEDLSLSMNSLVKTEQNYVKGVIESFAWLLLSIIAVAMIAGIIEFLWLWEKLFLPLKTIANATHDIALNKFVPFQVRKGKDEINNIYRAINTMTVDLEKQRKSLVEIENISDPEFIKELLIDIEQEVQRASDTVKGLLEFSRTHQFNLAPVDLREVTNKVLRLIAGEIPSGIAVDQTVPSHITLLLDSQKMTEALLNIVTNSMQAIDKHPGNVLITAQALPEEDKVVVQVKDNGKGIPPMNVQSIFDPFFSTKNSKEGTGLGLSVAYGIIKKHNGSISVESEVACGTVFTITLPWHKELQNF
jgi:signal transduction histidine kinase